MSAPSAVQSRMTVKTRPEIRKGCRWEITIRLDPSVLRELNAGPRIYLAPPADRDPASLPLLKLTVQSKLLRPLVELPITDVATILTDRPGLSCTKSGDYPIKVRRKRFIFVRCCLNSVGYVYCTPTGRVPQACRRDGFGRPSLFWRSIDMSRQGALLSVQCSSGACSSDSMS